LQFIVYSIEGIIESYNSIYAFTILLDNETEIGHFT